MKRHAGTDLFEFRRGLVHRYLDARLGKGASCCAPADSPTDDRYARQLRPPC